MLLVHNSRQSQPASPSVGIQPIPIHPVYDNRPCNSRDHVAGLSPSVSAGILRIAYDKRKL